MQLVIASDKNHDVLNTTTIPRQIDGLEVGRDVLLWNRSGPTGDGRRGETKEWSWKEGTKKPRKDEGFELALHEIDSSARVMIGAD